MTDYLAHAPDEATMIAAFKLLGVWDDAAQAVRGTGLSAVTPGAMWAIDYFRDWWEPAGETTRPGVYALLRWIAPNGEVPPPPPPGITLTTPLPADCPRAFAGDPTP